MIFDWLWDELHWQPKRTLYILFGEAAVAFHETVVCILVPNYIVDYGVGWSLDTFHPQLIALLVAIYVCAAVLMRGGGWMLVSGERGRYQPILT